MQMCLSSFHKISEQSSSSIQPSASIARLSLAFQLGHRQTQLHCQDHWSSPSCCIRLQEAEQRSAATKVNKLLEKCRRGGRKQDGRTEMNFKTALGQVPGFLPLWCEIFLVTSWWHLSLLQHEVRKLRSVLVLEYILVSISDFFACQ